MKIKTCIRGILFLSIAAGICVFGMSHAETDDLFLIRVSSDTEDQFEHLETLSLTVGSLDEETAVALLPAGNLPDLVDAGMTPEILDILAEEDRCFLVYFRGREEHEKLEKIGRVLVSSDHRAIIKVGPEWDPFGPKHGLELIQIFYGARKMTMRKPFSFSPSPYLDEVIQQVSPVRIYNFIQDLQSFQTRFAYADGCSLAADYLIEQFESFGLSVEEHWFFNSAWVGYDDPQRNIIATIPGTTNPDEIVAICAHYDSYSSEDPWNFAPGADDNASGTAAVLEMARILSQYAPERTLRFICFGGEEQWMIGSYAYVQERRATGDNFVAVINNDMIALTTEGDQEDIEVDCIPATEWLADEVMALASDFVTYPMTKNVDWGNVSDHTPFWENGYPAIEFSEDEANEIWGGASPYYHTPGDVIETLNIDFATQIVKMNSAALSSWAGVKVTGAILTYLAYSMDDDDFGESQGNGNGYVDPGETLELTVSLTNLGDQVAEGVRATLSTADAFTTIMRSTVDFDSIDIGGVAEGENPFTVSLATDCPNGHQVLLSLDIEDDQAHSWEAGLILTILQPNFVFSSYTLQEQEGNGDDKTDPGETVDLFITLENTGLRNASGIIAELETEDPDVYLIDNRANYPAMDMGAVAVNMDDPFTFQLSLEASTHALQFSLFVNEGQGYHQSEVIFRLLVGQGKILLVADDGDVNNQSYYAEVFSYLGVPFDLWEIEGVSKSISDTLQSYSEIIWFTGSMGNNTLTSEDQNILSAFLSNGGRLLLSGCLIGYDIGTTAFYRDYIHTNHVSFPTLLHHLTGTPSNPVVDDMNITLSSAGGNAQAFMAEIDPVSPAVSIFEYDRTTGEGPGLIRSSGCGALAVENSQFKAVYFAFGLEGVEPFVDRARIVEDVLLWFKEPGVDKSDVDGNGLTNIIDVVITVNIILGSRQATEEELARADMNYDGRVDVLDVISIVNAILGGGANR
jgi:hypothetical protein